ncbi:ATP-binding protein [Dysgonomonas sp. OttesenSCG-928-D17]|nr:ATP-binding protein [Dysgonomonas sp. OttesenSCG-928-D17]
MTDKLSDILNNINVARDEFRIIAIRLLPNTADSIKKNLQDSRETIDSWYFFYNNFKITSDGVIKETTDIVDKIPQNMYLPNAGLNSSSNPKVNISAIVGMNGDGKSAIIELLIRIMNNLTRLTFKSPIVSFIDNLNAELVYSIGNTFFTLSIKDEHVNISVQQDEEIIGGLSKVELSSIDLVSKIGFYSLIVNYSQYAYNSNDFVNENNANTQEGCWISKLFHKNDAYQTPIVLNPYRDEGVVEINNENSLARTRLISLILTPKKESLSSFKRINNKQEVNNLMIAYRSPSKYDEEVEKWRVRDLQREKDSQYFTRASFENITGDLEAYWKVRINKISKIYSNNKQQENSIEDIERAYQYLVYKTISISCKYEKFKKIIYIDSSNKNLNDETYSKPFNELINAIWEDGSHITLKIRQTIAFILFQHLSISKIIAPDTSINYISSQIQNCYEILGKQEYRRTTKYTWELIDLIPPPFLDMEIFLRKTEGNDNNKPFPFSSLSSGEKQQVYSLSSILYHLRNLNSVEGDGSLIKYSYINIILEEIELYFHPEMQRQYIYHLLESIKSIDVPS